MSTATRKSTKGRKSGPTREGDGAPLPAEVPAAEPARDSARLFGNADAPLGLHIFLRRGREGGSIEDQPFPFVVLDESDPLARTFLAGLVTSNGTCVSRLALRAQRSDCPLQQTLNPTRDATNAAIDQTWRQQLEGLAADRGKPGASPVWDMWPTDEAGRPGKHPPTWLCKKRACFFVPRCPQTLEILADCRDDGLLSSHGLPSYSQGTQRFLYSPRAAAEGEPIFYSSGRADPVGGEAAMSSAVPGTSTAQVRGPDELVIDQGHIVNRLDEIHESDPATHAELLRTMPCCGCPHATVCYPNDGSYAHALDRLVPFSFFEFFAVGGELFELNFAETADLLAGGGAGEPPSTEAGAASAQARFFAADPHGRDVLEVLRLKLGLVSAVVRDLSRWYATSGAPHLNLTPDRVQARFSAVSGGFPAWWNLRAELAPAAPPRRLPLGGSEDVVISSPPSAPDEAYTAEVLRGAGGELGRLRRGRAAILDVSSEKTPDGHMRVELTIALEDPSLDETDLYPIDVVQMLLPLSGSGATTALYAHPTADKAEHDDAAGVRLRAERVAEPHEIKRLTAMKGQQLANVEYAVYRCYHAPCDMYSVGALMVRALLARDEKRFAAALKEVRAFEAALRPAAAPLPVEEAAACGDRLWLHRTEQDASRAIWSSSDTLYKPANRKGDQPNAIPPQLWQDVCRVMLRLMVWVPGYGYCAHRADFDTSDPAAKLDVVADEIDRLIRRADEALFDQTVRNQEVRNVVRELLGELEDGDEK